MEKTKILYIEDEPNLARIVKESLESRSYNIIHLSDGSKTMEAFTDFNPQICIFDVMLPDADGFVLAKQIRQINKKIPIIFLTAKTQTTDVIEGFGAGGNDYVRKPFSMEELIVRIENLLYLASSKTNNIKDDDTLSLGNYKYYFSRQELAGPNSNKQLSYREAQLFEKLLMSKNEIVLRKQILIDLWGNDSIFNSRNLDVYITKLRDYLKDDSNIKIITLKSVGYKLIVI